MALQQYRDEIDAGTVPHCGKTLDVPPPDLPPTEEDVEAARETRPSWAPESDGVWLPSHQGLFARPRSA